ncbi:MAG: hypothetical protein FWG13_04325 [Leptospirales bacterium]|nr:hypothetical protein [Leptospirales bacterium]
MIKNHITFEQLSNFYDNETARDEAVELVEHVKSCSFCQGEQNQLAEMLEYCSILKETFVCREDFVKKTMGVIKWRARRRALVARLPIAAASVVVVGGAFALVSILNRPAQTELAANTTAKNKPSYSALPATDVENVMGILSSNNASVLKVSDLFIEGEIPAVYFPRLRRELGFRKVFYKVGERSGLDQSGLNPYVKEVSVGSHSSVKFLNEHDKSEYVRFRVFK